MLQRIQTVFLLIVVVCMGLTFLFPIWEYSTLEGREAFKLFNLKLVDYRDNLNSPQELYYPFAIVASFTVASMTVGITEIFKYKNRLLQMKLGAFNSLLMTCTLGSSTYFATDLIDSGEVFSGGNYGLALFLPAGAMICNLLANRFIRKDEKLVRSIDRIR